MKNGNTGFVHLHVHTDYSLLDSLVSIDELLDEVQRQGSRACAITDTGNMSGAIEFYEKAMKRNIKPIIGCEINVSALGHNSFCGSLILLARNLEGYQNLMKIVSTGHIEKIGKNPPVIGKDILEKYSGGLIALSGGLDGEIGKLLLEERDEEAWEIALEFSRIFGKGNFYLELQGAEIDKQAELNKLNICVSHHLDIPLVITGPVHYLHKNDEDAYEAIRKGLNGGKAGSYLKTEEELMNKFSYVLEGMTNAGKISDKCNVELDLKTRCLPEFLQTLEKSNTAFFERLVKEGIKARYKDVTENITRRVEQEVKVIKEAGLIDYFLIFWDFVNYAKEQGIPTGPGRGAAPGSIVNYALGITEVDPIKHGLIFERFFSLGSEGFPEIILDFCFERRDEVMDYVREKYSKDKVCGIITFGRISSISALRYAGRGIGIDDNILETVIEWFPREKWPSCKGFLDLVPKMKKLYEEDTSVKKLIDTASRIEEHYSHAGSHSCGIVVSDKPLMDRIPLFRTCRGEIISGFSKDALEKIGMVKIDFLGLKTLTHINETVGVLIQTRNININMKEIPTDDKRTYELLSDGDTVGVFQMESSRMRELLKKLKPENIGDIAGLLALYRPSTIKNGLLKDFVDRKKVVHSNDLLNKILEDTRGLLIYQEQVMRILSEIGGFNMVDANNVRKELSRKFSVTRGLDKNLESMEKVKGRFLEGCIERGLEKEDSLQVWELLECLGPCSFSKAHVIAYAIISYRAAYLKANYPEEFEKSGKETQKQKMR
jgi:DNA polymerase III subunit alpha